MPNDPKATRLHRLIDEARGALTVLADEARVVGDNCLRDYALAAAETLTEQQNIIREDAVNAQR
jgi:hypothetical protein